ncbi:hypothetical protein HGRIS_013347 [Hohenbuehelia grisea]|uniref:Xylanolytic transcriptional activator regulatory domain-containing protein n=1 Tax=Hohenbuehelia grisea TaxID=104357 RepID=A0ABR3IV87_9AGAR
MDPQSQDTNPESTPKAQVVRGARACTVCRAAKASPSLTILAPTLIIFPHQMKCVGAEDGQKQCQRCKRAGVECIFEKHRRGRKPGSKLSEASKMLRRLEKGLNNAKLKSQSTEEAMANEQQTGSGSRFPSSELPALNPSPYGNPDDYNSRPMDMDDEDEDRNEPGLFPAKLIRKEDRRNSFFRTILNPEEAPPSASSSAPSRSPTLASPLLPRAPTANGLCDPITAGIIDDATARVLFDLFYLRLNPFINLFDPALHTVAYVRAKCPFLFTTLIMAGCKFFKPEVFKPCQKLANDFAVHAFAEQWKRVEVVQAFACLTYWKDPNDNRTWTFIGYACRMAVELNLNRHVLVPPANETEFQLRERRNRERTYLVLWVHDRSLSTQTGRNWMLPEDELVRHSMTWHEEGGGSLRPEDVILAAMVQLRRIASETTDMFYTPKGPTAPATNHHDVNYDLVLRSCNGKLTQWMDTWQREMQRANGESFHFSFLRLFRLGVRLFLNSFGLTNSMSPSSHAIPSVQSVTACCTSALDSLNILSKDFAQMSMLRYGQDSITVMSAYAAVFLLKLLRNPSTAISLQEGTSEEIYSLITKTSEAYLNVSALPGASPSSAYHARFLRNLVTHNDIFKAPRRNERDRVEGTIQIDPRLQGSPGESHTSMQSSPTQPGYVPQCAPPGHDQAFHFPASPHLPAHPTAHVDYGLDPSVRSGNPAPGIPSAYQGHGQGFVPTVAHATELDAHYWKNMFLELGFGGEDPVPPPDDARMQAQYAQPHPQPPHAPQPHHAQAPYVHPQGYPH